MADSDSALMFTLLAVFVALAIFLPFINDAFGQPGSVFDIQNISAVSSELSNGDLGILDFVFIGIRILVSIGLMFVFTFGGVPVIVDLIILEPMRLFFYYLMARMIRGI